MIPNRSSAMYVTPQSGLMNRRRFQICKVIIATSLVWFMIDVFLLMYFTDCGTVVKSEDCENKIKTNDSVVRAERGETPIPGNAGRPEKRFHYAPTGECCR